MVLRCFRRCGPVAILVFAAVIALTSGAQARHHHRHSRHHHGFGMVLPADTAPGLGASPQSEFGCRRGRCRSIRAPAMEPPRSTFLSEVAELVSACLEETGKFSTEVAQEVERQVAPTDAQRQAFTDFQQASDAAGNAMRAGCPTTMSGDPIGRLDDAVKGLRTILHAADIAAPALRSFYAQLDDEQKAHINFSPRETKNDAGALVRTCATPPWLGDTSQHLTDIQKDAFEQARQSVDTAGNRLKAECPRSNLLTPPRRLEAARQRAEAILRFIETIRPDLARYYATLKPRQQMITTGGANILRQSRRL